MLEETIDFGNLSKKVIVSPIVPLQLINIKCRSGSRVQATILGNVYSAAIEILEIVPVGFCEEDKVKTIDFQQHQRYLENITSVYPTLQILGVAVTDLKPDINLAILHTMYSNKQSGFKTQGILQYPILLSIGTKLTQHSTSLPMDAYSFNPTFKYCKDFLEVTSFEKLDAHISFGDTEFQSVTPLFEAFNNQQKVIPKGNAQVMMRELILRLKQLKIACEKDENPKLKIKLSEIVDRLNSKHDYTMEELSYLLDLASLQKKIAFKMNKFH